MTGVGYLLGYGPALLLAAAWTITLRRHRHAQHRAHAEQAAIDEQYWDLITHLILTTEETDQ